MSNHLSNGTVLPSGLLGINTGRSVGAFNKAYKNTSLRMGVVVKSYAYNDPNNYSGLSTEYDVLVIEQNESVSFTNVVYRNCLSSEGMGSIADFFEKNLRVKQGQSIGTQNIDTADQNGAVVLLLCLDGMTQKGIILSGLTNPERQTTLLNSSPYLQGEYNGVNIIVNTDGSTALTFQGATDNDGNVIDPSQGNTVFQIHTDGSFEFNHSTVDILASKSGSLTITTKGDCDINSSGAVNLTSSGNTVVNSSGDCDVTASGNVVVTGSVIELNGNSAEVLTTISQPVVDSIFGEPSVGFQSVKTGS